MLKKILFIIIFLTSLFGCSSPQFITDIIMFDKEIYTPTFANDIKVFNSRLDIPNKYFEIGTIKFQGDPIVERIQNLAAEKGADAVIKDANNFILIKFKTEQQEEKLNETKTI